MNKRWYRYIALCMLIGMLQATGHYAHEDISCMAVSFEESLGKRIGSDNSFIAQLKKLYEKHKPSNAIKLSNGVAKIPRIIHQIWLGSPLPQQYKAWQKTWQELHPEWEYILWTDADVENLNMRNKDLFDRATNYGEKSDIMRCEILYQMGGVYVDMDFACLQPFDILHCCYDFYMGIIGPMGTGFLANGIIGSVPRHPILKHYLDNLPARWQDKKNGTNLLKRSGPFAFAQSVEYCLSSHNKQNLGVIIAFPPTYFFPIPFSMVPRGICLLSPEEIAARIKPETFAIHYWSASWAKPAAYTKLTGNEFIIP